MTDITVTDMTLTAEQSSRADIRAAAATLSAGGLVAFPTETVYGLGADARNEQALYKIFELKGRPSDHPLILHLASSADLPAWVEEVPPQARLLAAHFWPGPLTLVLRKHPRVSKVLTGGQDSIAVRVPAHPVAQALLQDLGSAIAAPSANRYGRLSPTRAAHVRDEFGERLPVLEGGECEIGLESTILSLLEHPPRLLRPGTIPVVELERVLGSRLATPSSVARDAAVPRVPGSTLQHYAPRTPLSLVAPSALRAEIERAAATGRTVAVLTRANAQDDERTAVAASACLLRWVQAPADAAGFAHDLYARLRELDKLGAGRILVAQVPERPEWDAVRDRLQRAASGVDDFS